jgi:UDP-N-acetylglucosamine:LPS N-acetylglucosamine transferase
VDIGIPMVDAMLVNQEETIAAYKEIHSEWARHIKFEEQRLAVLQPDIVLSNVGYIPLQAAANLSIPAIALCSLDWASTWQVFGSQDDEGKAIFNQIVRAYCSAKMFLQLTPHLPMVFLDNTISVPFVVRQGKSNRHVIDQCFPLCLGKKLILISMGGMDAEINFEQWPKIDQVVYLVSGKNILPNGFIHTDELNLDFSDIMASVDVVLTKTGYGMAVESAVNQTPLFYVARIDWPEHEVMFEWCQENNCVLEVNRSELEQGLTKDRINSLFSLPAKNKVFDVRLGAEICADYIQSLM